MKKYFIAAFVILSACKKDAGIETAYSPFSNKDSLVSVSPEEDSIIDMSPIDAKGEILFLSRRIINSSDWKMFLMNVDGTNQRPLSNNLVHCSPPILSNSGTKVAFTTYDNNFYYNLYLIDLDGQNQRFLSRGKQSCPTPAWSPDDSRIVFVKNDNTAGDRNDIYSIKPDGSGEIRLTSQNNNFSPQYFPDNNSIIFCSSINNIVGIYKMNIDGSNKQLLTPQNKSFSDPKISPDGNMISITSIDWNGSQIFVMNRDGSNLKQITFTVSSKYFDTGYPRDGNRNPVWSPDSKRIAYVSYENGSPDIFIINADGTKNKRLTNTDLRDESPAWTKDGNYILFSSNRNMNVSTEIYIMRTAGQLQTPLTNYIGDDVYPTYINK